MVTSKWILLNCFSRSYGELAFLCLGRPSVFIVNSILAIGTSLIVVMYGLMFSNLARNLLLMLLPEQRSSIWLTKYALCAFLFVLLLPVVYRKNIKELRGITYLLFTGVITMLVVFFFRAMSETSSEAQQDGVHYEKGSVFDSMTIILTSYGFILNFYPVFSSL